MIDALEVSLPRGTPLMPDMRDYLRSQRPKVSKYYHSRFDLRHVGIDAALHYSCRFTRNHKLQLFDTSAKSLSRICTIINQVADCDPLRLRIGRIDLAVDVSRVPVAWFRNHTYCPRRRVTIAGATKSVPDNDPSYTLYLGSDPDLFRIYDKKAEQKYRKDSVDADDDDGLPVTRLERQLRSGRVPDELRTVGNLTCGLKTFNPFAPLLLLRGGRIEPQVEDYRLNHYLEGMGLRQIICQNGLAQTWRLVSARTRGNARRKFLQLIDFIPPDPEKFQIPDLYLLYRMSIERQFGKKAG